MILIIGEKEYNIKSFNLTFEPEPKTGNRRQRIYVSFSNGNTIDVGNLLTEIEENFEGTLIVTNSKGTYTFDGYELDNSNITITDNNFDVIVNFYKNQN